ncbi:MAG: hypothetical protein EXR72_08820 [Myxococcales bacterium]|nr:hypothetical protein [Myxococcales bacterium]
MSDRVSQDPGIGGGVRRVAARLTPALALCLVAARADARPALVGASDVLAFRAAMAGARAGLPEAQEYDLSAGAEAVVELVEADRPEVIIAVGPAALRAALQVRGAAPIVFLMVADAAAMVRQQGEHPLLGIDLHVVPATTLGALRRLCPGPCRLWTQASRSESGAFVEELRAAAKGHGIELVVGTVEGAAEALRAAARLPAALHRGRGVGR